MWREQTYSWQLKQFKTKPYLTSKKKVKGESNENKLREPMWFCRFSQNFTEELMNGCSQEEPLWLDILPYLTLSPSPNPYESTS